MSVQLLPADYDLRFQEAVRNFWTSRSAGVPVKSQGGSRDAVITGKNMDGFCELVGRVAAHCGLPPEAVQTRRKSFVLPGYFRATKTWDVLVIHQRRLIAAFEFKSQVGSLGNNFNNRSEEAIGSAADLWVAHRHGAYTQTLADPALRELVADPRPPFLGWLMLLEDSAEARSPVGVEEPNYPAFPEFRGASYARRYQLSGRRGRVVGAVWPHAEGVPSATLTRCDVQRPRSSVVWRAPSLAPRLRRLLPVTRRSPRRRQRPSRRRSSSAPRARATTPSWSSGRSSSRWRMRSPPSRASRGSRARRPRARRSSRSDSMAASTWGGPARR